MQNQKTKRILQELWIWISISANCLIAALHLTEQEYRSRGILFAVMTMGFGVLKIWAEKDKGGISFARIVIDCVCMYILTFLVGINLASYLPTVSVLNVLGIAVIIETLIFLCITYWHRLCRFLFKSKQRNNKA